LKRLSGLDEGLKALLRDADLSAVHKVHDGLHHPAPEILEDDDRMLAGRLREDALEEGRAGGEDHFVGPDRGLRADKSHVHQRFGLQQCVEGSQDVVLVIVPAQAVVILWGRARTWCPS